METEGDDPTASGSAQPQPVQRVQPETVITSVYGHIVKLTQQREEQNNAPNTSDLDEFLNSYGIDTFGEMDRDTRKKTWIKFNFTAIHMCRDLFRHLSSVCDLVAVGISGVNECSAVIHRKTYQVLGLMLCWQGQFHANANANANKWFVV